MGRTKLKNKLTSLANTIRERTGITGELTIEQMETHVKEFESMPETIILTDEAGNEVTAILTEEEVTLTATPNDIRLGTTAVTGAGVVEGEKVIPTYHTYEGNRAIPAGSNCTIYLPDLDTYDYTKLQVIICPFNSSVAGSVSAEQVCIEDHIYNVKSTTPIADVSKNSETKMIELGITNNSGTLLILRYFTYKEIY